MNERNIFHLKDKVSAISHFVGFIISLFLMPLLLIKASTLSYGILEMVALSIFSLSMIFLYLASTLYHALNLESRRGNIILHKLDHIMITFLIAGTYTPLSVICLQKKECIILLSLIWTLALLSAIFKIIWIKSPRWLNSTIYILMGWAFVPVSIPIYKHLTLYGFLLLLLGGILYTTGAILYAIKPKKIEKNKNFKSHEMFHLFTIGGTLSLYFMVFFYVI